MDDYFACVGNALFGGPLDERKLWDRITYDQQRNFAALGNALAPRDKRADAIAYLRSRQKYCLDFKQGRIPPKEQPESILTKWLHERRKAK